MTPPHDTEASPPPTAPPDLSVPSEWASVVAALSSLDKLLASSAEETRRLREEVRSFNTRADKFIEIAEKCFERTQTVDQKTEELARVAAEHRRRLDVVEEWQRDREHTILPPNGNGVGG